MPRLIVITGPNGVGKSTLTDKALNDHILHLHRVVRHTTRKPNPAEKDGHHYYFVDSLTFQRMIDNHQFIEWAVYPPGFYGTSYKSLEDIFCSGVNAIIELDVNAAIKVIHYCQDQDFSYQDIFVLPISCAQLNNQDIDSALITLRQRMIDRRKYSDLDYSIIEDRLKYARDWLAQADKFTYLVENLNNRLPIAYNQIRKIILSKI